MNVVLTGTGSKQAQWCNRLNIWRSLTRNGITEYPNTSHHMKRRCLTLTHTKLKCRLLQPSLTSCKSSAANCWLNHYRTVSAGAKNFKPEDQHVQDLYDGLLLGDRAALAQSITLVESKLGKRKSQARLLLTGLLPHLKHEEKRNKGVPKSFRIGMKIAM